MNKTVKIILWVAGAAAVGFTGYFLYKKFSGSSSSTAVTPGDTSWDTAWAFLKTQLPGIDQSMIGVFKTQFDNLTTLERKRFIELLALAKAGEDKMTTAQLTEYTKLLEKLKA